MEPILTPLCSFLFLLDLWLSSEWMRASLVAQMVKNLPAKQGTWVWSGDQEDPLEKGMVTHSSILAWETPEIELQSMGSQRVEHNWATNTLNGWGCEKDQASVLKVKISQCAQTRVPGKTRTKSPNPCHKALLPNTARLNLKEVKSSSHSLRAQTVTQPRCLV